VTDITLFDQSGKDVPSHRDDVTRIDDVITTSSCLCDVNGQTSVLSAKRRGACLPHFQRGGIRVSVSGFVDAAEAAETRDQTGT